MKVGLIGVGMVGGTLKRWFEDNTNFEIRCFDPDKGMCDYLDGCDAIFISIPVENNNYGQNLEYITQAVFDAQKITPNVFIRSTVLPGTNDSLGTIAMPEFLTARRAYTDMCKLPILCGNRKPCGAERIDITVSVESPRCTFPIACRAWASAWPLAPASRVQVQANGS